VPEGSSSAIAAKNIALSPNAASGNAVAVPRDSGKLRAAVQVNDGSISWYNAPTSFYGCCECCTAASSSKEGEKAYQAHAVRSRPSFVCYIMPSVSFISIPGISVGTLGNWIVSHGKQYYSQSDTPSWTFCVYHDSRGDTERVHSQVANGSLHVPNISVYLFPPWKAGLRTIKLLSVADNLRRAAKLGPHIEYPY